MTIPVLAAAAAAGGGALKFSSTTYSGTGASQNIVTRVNNSGDGGLVWIKRTDTTGNHFLFDTVRGVNKYIEANGNGPQATLTSSVTSFNSNGVTLGTAGDVNGSSSDFVLFNWFKESGYFDIVNYTGNATTSQTIPHGLGVSPAMILSKSYAGNARPWGVFHTQLNGGINSARYSIPLSDTGGGQIQQDGFGGYVWADTLPDSSNFYVGNRDSTNDSSCTYIAYLFAEKAGFSKAGAYTGNGTTNAITGLGFKPSAVLIKRTDSISNWFLGYNNAGTVNAVFPNLANAADTNPTITFDSDGFTWTGGGFNTSGAEYIYFAWR